MATQSASLARIVPQAAPAHTYGLHITVPVLAHIAMALHVFALVCVPFMHDWAAQTVPGAYFAHAPAPLHSPVVPHVEAACCMHSSSGSLPCAMAPHTPSVPCPFFAAVQATHG